LLNILSLLLSPYLPRHVINDDEEKVHQQIEVHLLSETNRNVANHFDIAGSQRKHEHLICACASKCEPKASAKKRERQFARQSALQHAFRRFFLLSFSLFFTIFKINSKHFHSRTIL